MASIRMPANAKLFYRFCAASEEPDRDLVMFPTWAHMLISAAAVGCHHQQQDNEPELLNTNPYPIPLETFSGGKVQLNDYLLMMAISTTLDPTIVDNEDRICRIIEGYASAGFRHMAALHEECGGPYQWVQAWQDLVTDVEVEIDQKRQPK